MTSIVEIMDMLDWHQEPEIQARGRILAQKIEPIAPFIQPLTLRHNKNVWENCAIIIAERNDEEIKQHLIELLEWLQDMNWPGFFQILHRLQVYSDNISINNAVAVCEIKAKDSKDIPWENNLRLLKLYREQG